ncbi:MAG: NAD-dependent epimerase/dehydratase family protein [Chloroflexi bacterium]|nr:NAD-dependent epimerase/dehydratase family protein [Chloroflexota bacterium]
MRVLVIGGTGFIGAPVVHDLDAGGHEVAVFHRGLTETPLPSHVVHIRGDRADIRDYTAAFKQFAPDVVVDITPMVEAEARAAVDAVRAVGRGGAAPRFVAVSSMDVYLTYGRLHGTESGAPVPTPLTEESSLRSVHYPYRGKVPGLERYEKILVERVVMSAPDVDGVVVRLPMVYGPRDRQCRLFDDLKRMDDGRPAILLPEGLADWRAPRGYVHDCAHAVVLAATHPRARGRIFHVAEPEALSQEAWIRAIAEAAGWSGRIVRVPEDLLPPAWRSPIDPHHHWEANSSRIRAELGFREDLPRFQALQRTIAWQRQHPPAIDARRFDYRLEDKVLARVAS